MKRALAVALVTSFVTLVAPMVSAQEEDRAADALTRDVSRIVGSEESSGWFIDEASLEEIYPTIMESLCRTPLESRERARVTLRERSQSRGDSRALYEADAKKVTSRVDKARRAERELKALELALERAATRCPYWIEPDPAFRGRQSDADRFTLSLETGGLIQLRQTAGTLAIGGGGAARILPGYGFRGRVTLLTGPEFGGGAMLKPNTEPSEFVINYFPAFPVVVRFHDGGWQYDAEAAPVALFQADNGNWSWGARIGGAVGIKALRTRGVLPWAGIAFAYEHYFPSGGRPRAHFIRGGLRVGLMWDP